ncbi:MAG: hypothetical protein HYV09_11500 [Deltaproteobacteria bacterium]|nr:hypothetical protein [Deltaproteobacteria bacterium]
MMLRSFLSVILFSSVGCIALDEPSPVEQPGERPPSIAITALIPGSACARTMDGTVVCRGNSGWSPSADFADMIGMARVAEEGLGRPTFSTSCLVTSAGAVRCTGYGGLPIATDGTCSHGGGFLSGPETTVPCARAWHEIAGLDRVTQIAGSCVLRDDGSVRCWPAATKPAYVAVREVSLPERATRISAAANGRRACALLQSRRIACWDPARDVAPTVVGGLDDVHDLGVASDHACVIRGDGAAFCWGENHCGQLGDGTTIHREAPTRVLGDRVHRRLIASSLFWVGTTCSLTDAGEIACWGAAGPQTETASASVEAKDCPLRAVRLPWTVAGVSDARDFTLDDTTLRVLRADGAVLEIGRLDDGEVKLVSVAPR